MSRRGTHYHSRISEVAPKDRKKRTAEHRKLVEICRRADEAGMSYGKYMARNWLAGKPDDGGELDDAKRAERT